MDFFKKQKQKIAVRVFLTLVVLAVSFVVYYATATEATNIKTEYKYAYSENGSWLNFGSSDGGVMVEDSALTGYIWSENIGWISLNCANNNSCATSNYKVANNSEGDLSGYAWGENIGWINFAPSNGGVHINSSGEFSGYAWGENIGWIIFNCQDVDSCSASDFGIKTTWLPLSVRNLANQVSNDSDDDEDVSGLEVSDVHFSSTDTTIVINWDTNHSANSHVRWGKDKNLEEEKNNNNKERKHRIILRNLEPNKKYFFRVKSTDGNDNSDSSRIYNISTKSAAAIFVKRQYESFNKDKEKEIESNLEKVQVEVIDKSEVEIKKDIEIAKEMEVLKPASTEVVDNAPAIENPSAISAFFSANKENISNFFSNVYYFALSGQRKVVGFFGWTGEQISSAYDSVISKFSKEKANQVARVNQVKFFTTQVFSRNEKKLLAEVRFQILDKAENPIANLDTMLFSDPQSSVTDENGITTFRDVPIGSHTLAFEYQGENFQKKVAIADTLTDDGNVRAEVVQVKAEKEKIAIWMWAIIVLLIAAVACAIYFARKYYQLKNKNIS